MSDGLVKILDGNTFVVSDACGDIEASSTDPTGLFSFDTRFLSRWVLTVNGERLNSLSVDDLQYFEARFFLVPGTGTVYVDAKLSVIRQRAVGNGFHEGLTILNHADEPVDLRVRVDAGCDFADLFEVKDALEKKGTYSARVDGGKLVLSYDRGTFGRSTAVSASAPAQVDKDGLTFQVRIGAHDEWSTDLDVVTERLGAGQVRRQVENPKRSRRRMREDLERWIDAAPRLECDWRPLEATYRRSLVDLAALRFSPLISAGRSLPAAGLPWFMSMFGRDSILTSLQALPFAPELASTTLRALGDWQGVGLDDFRDEDPGRIPHEMRYGEMTAFEERPHSPYYGSADATPLYVVLLDEYERWTGDRALVRELEGEARAALNWIDEYADLQGTGYVGTGAVTRRPGSRISAGRTLGIRSRFATADCPASLGRPVSCRGTRTMRSFAVLAWRGWCGRIRRSPTGSRSRPLISSDASTGTSGSRTASTSRLRLTPTETRSTRLPPTTATCCGAASPTSPRPRPLHATCCGPRLFSGWGVRTLAEGQGRYNPIGYHVGTVWPFDNSFIAWGLRRYGFKEDAAVIAAGILDAAQFFDGRLPEAFGGYERSQTMYPVQYPTACSPQAWSTGAPLLLLRTMLGLEPHGDNLVVDPALPSSIGHLELLDIPGRWGRIDAFGRGRIDIHRRMK